MRKNSSSLSRMLLCAAVVAAALSFSCGRKADPVPDRSRDAFSMGEMSASMTGGLLEVKGKVSGVAQNAEYFILEVQPITGELCEGCPFLSQEQQRTDAVNAMDSKDISKFGLSYRPQTDAPSYKWRVTGYNVHAGMPPIATDVFVVSKAASGDAIPVPVMGSDELGDVLSRESSLPEPPVVPDSNSQEQK